MRLELDGDGMWWPRDGGGEERSRDRTDLLPLGANANLFGGTHEFKDATSKMRLQGNDLKETTSRK